MSNVKKRDRKKSGFQVVDTADDLCKKTLMLCAKLPKRYTFLVSQKLMNYAADVAGNCHQGNFYPKNAHEAQMRRDSFLSARGCLISLIAMVNLFLDDPEVITVKDTSSGEARRVTMPIFEEYLDLLDKELDLISGTLSSDDERFKNLN